MEILFGLFAIVWIALGIWAALNSPRGRNARAAGMLSPLGFGLNALENAFDDRSHHKTELEHLLTSKDSLPPTNASMNLEISNPKRQRPLLPKKLWTGKKRFLK